MTSSCATPVNIVETNVTVLLIQDYDDLAVIDKEWCEVFPDPNDRPARQVMRMGVQRKSRVQFHMIAAV